MVAGEGQQPSRGMVIGEAPGFEEIKVGRPFVGQSGKLLDVVLHSCGVSREDLFITNVVKEIPLTSEGRIRRPLKSEVEAWREILEGEIQNTAPLSILALGRTAFEALTGASGDFKWAGARIDNIFGAWHPSFLLRQGHRQPSTEWLEQIRPWAEGLWGDE